MFRKISIALVAAAACPPSRTVIRLVTGPDRAVWCTIFGIPQRLLVW